MTPYEEFDWDAFQAEEDRKLAEYRDWWDSLTDEERAEERRMMDAHYEEYKAREDF